ncbi:hypothetical protein ACFSL6_24200 [Paenibacillus thailandensis]|uniref:Uncharacterized protein n=1 Tax=Paenibacillus thailandensis TaxID=393250 RepID=A0ABW5R3C5_9BACL
MDRSKGKAEGPASKEASDPDLEGCPEANSFGAEWTSPSTKNLSHVMRQVFCCFCFMLQLNSSLESVLCDNEKDGN